MLETRLAKEVDGDGWTFGLSVFLLLELCLDSVQVSGAERHCVENRDRLHVYISGSTL